MQTGEVILLGYLRGVLRLRCTRSEVRAAIHHIMPPELVEARRRRTIVRREYDAIASGHVDHIDTHHKLGKWGFVTLGVVDGHSHRVRVLTCNTNNKAVTVKSL